VLPFITGKDYSDSLFKPQTALQCLQFFKWLKGLNISYVIPSIIPVYLSTMDIVKPRENRRPARFSHIVKGVYNPPNYHYTEVALEESHRSLIGRIIGRDGFYFKAITAAARIAYIWYNDSRNAIEVWGYHDRLQDAVERIKARVHKVVEQVNENKNNIQEAPDATATSDSPTVVEVSDSATATATATASEVSESATSESPTVAE
jgi:hypothetical protein